MTIAVLAGKGGVGKTTLSYNLAKHYNGYILSNDKWSKIGAVYEYAKIIDDIEFIDSDEYNIIYDFAGHIDGRVIDIVKNVDEVIFVTTPDIMSIGGTVEVVSELKEYIKDGFIVANQIGLKGAKYDKEKAESDYSLVKEKVGDQFGLDTLPLRFTSTFQSCLLKGQSIEEQANTPLLKRVWKTELEQFQKIIERIENGKNN